VVDLERTGLGELFCRDDRDRWFVSMKLQGSVRVQMLPSVAGELDEFRFDVENKMIAELMRCSGGG